MRFPAVLRWRRSWPLAALIAVVHLAALIALGFTSLAVAWGVGGALLIIVSALHAGFVWRSAAGELRLHEDGRCDYRAATGGDFGEARLLWHSAWPAIVSLEIETLEPPARRVLICTRGALSASEERRLRLWLRCCSAGGGAERGRAPA